LILRHHDCAVTAVLLLFITFQQWCTLLAVVELLLQLAALQLLVTVHTAAAVQAVQPAAAAGRLFFFIL
jgi:hypothetical protein